MELINTEEGFKQPNILFLMSDEHGFRYMGHIPYEEGGEPVDTPNFDKLASKAAVFTDAYCQMPLCGPSRLSMLSGLEIAKCGAWSNSSVRNPEIKTIAQVMTEAGYETCAIGKMHFGGSLQFCGFKHRPFGDLTGGDLQQYEAPSNRGNTLNRIKGVGTTVIPESLIQDNVIANEAVAFLREQRHKNPEKPWFLYTSFMRPHFPLRTPSRFFEKYWSLGVTEPRVGRTGDAYNHPMSISMRHGFKADKISDEETMKARAAYFACVSYLDEIIGDFISRLEQDGLLDNTIIVYTSDHGEMAGEHGVWFKNAWYEACTRVPLIISLPEHRYENKPAERCKTPVGLVDLFPTLCSLAGIEYPDNLDGFDLSEAVKGKEDAPKRPVFCDNLNERWGADNQFRMIRWEHYKYVRFRNSPELFFNLENDPDEQHNLAGTVDPELKNVLERLRKIAKTSLDFEAAEISRKTIGDELKEKYKLKADASSVIHYHLSDGRVISADEFVENPKVIFEDSSKIYPDLIK